ncbi:hypothetical protein MASR2M48_10520 [Spirochaetota bacterium]
MLAKQIHFTLSGAQSPLIYANWSSIPATLFESELFGHEKGSFTGANAQKKGRVELANGGTLLLDEITEIPFDIQAKLLDSAETTFIGSEESPPSRGDANHSPDKQELVRGDTGGSIQEGSILSPQCHSLRHTPTTRPE